MRLSDINQLQLEITSHCNIKCPQCSRTSFDGELSEFVELKNWDIKKILPNLQIDQLVSLQEVGIQGDNGDALMHPHIESIIDFFYNAPSQPILSIVTNGTMRSTEWWSKLGSKYTDRVRIQFSIDGLDDTYHLYRVGGIFKNAINNAKAFIDAGGHGTARTIVFKHNQHQLEEIVKVSRETGFKQLSFIPNDNNRFKGQKTWPVIVNGTKSHSIESTTLSVEEISKYNYIDFKETRMLFFFRNPKELCTNFMYGKIRITYKGHLIPCCLFHADLYFDHPSNDAYRKLVGDPDKIDLNKHLLSDIIEDPDFYSTRLNESITSNNLLPKCVGCRDFGTSPKQLLISKDHNE